MVARAIAPLALMALIFVLSAQDTPGGPSDLASVIGHFTEYALLTVLWIWALAPELGRRALPVAAAIAFVYALSDEFHQSFVEGRDADPLDVLVDACGIAFALIVVRFRGLAAR